MKNLSHIVNKVYGRPWLVQPNVLNSIGKQLENILQGKADMPMDPMDPEMPDEPVCEEPVNGIAVICVEGIIGKHLSMLEMVCGGCDVDEISEQLKEAVDDANVQKIVLLFNTPGGTVTGVSELAQQIDEATQVKEVIGFTDTLCASAGMWLASQCTSFYCSPSSDVGSVGVYSLYMDASVMYANEGLKVNAISAGKYKLTGAEFRAMTDEERAMLQADVDTIYNDFKAAVTKKRKCADEDLQGQCFSGVEAVKRGFADGLINNTRQLFDLLAMSNE